MLEYRMPDTACGILVIRLEFDSHILRNLRLTIPQLSINNPLEKITRINRVPAGSYDAIIRAKDINGLDTTFPVRLTILAGQTNVHEFPLKNSLQKVWIRPIDSGGRTILFSEVKLEGVDSTYRSVRNQRGIEYTIEPGEYKLKLMLPSLVLKNLSVVIRKRDTDCSFLVDEKLPSSESRIQPRYSLSFPVSMKPSTGLWVPGNSINISSKGACVLSEGQNAVDENVQIRLFVPAAPTPMECPARICWTREMDMISSKIGLQLFLSDGLQSFLSKWLTTHPQRSR